MHPAPAFAEGRLLSKRKRQKGATSRKIGL